MNPAPRTDLRPYFLTFDDLSGPFEWAEFFGNQHPVEVEIGSGRGLFLFNAGQLHPDRNFLGIEIDFKEGRRAARRIAKREMPNVRILGGDAQVALAEQIQTATVSAVHVYFPDPWWKRRHKKRRVFTEDLVREIDRVLQPSGLLHVWTDVHEYYLIMSELVDQHPSFGPKKTPQERPAEHDMDYQTSFERKKRKMNLPIYRGEWVKIG